MQAPLEGAPHGTAAVSGRGDHVVGGNRVEKDIGCDWKTESRAKDELRTLNERHGNNGSRLFSLQKKPK